MKRLYFAVVLIVVSTAAFCQLFDGTIGGTVPGNRISVINHFSNKGFKIVSCLECPKDCMYMYGKMQVCENRPEEYVFAYFERTTNSDIISSITVFIAPENHLKSEYFAHVRRYSQANGVPARKYSRNCSWNKGLYVYTIGIEADRIYHQLKLR